MDLPRIRVFGSCKRWFSGRWHLIKETCLFRFRYQGFLNYQVQLYGTLPDTRARLSQMWIPTGGTAISSNEDSYATLVRAGFLRQAHSGIYHMLPLGHRVEKKLEALIDKHMSQLGASKLSLSSITSEELWKKSGRLDKARSELFHFTDRRTTKYLLSPTHEEEITSLVSNTIKSYKELPIRVYQITRKYRDEPRSRYGLFRSREFSMKDLYTFDYSPSSALSTYHKVREAYADILNELKLPYIEAEADSGNMGGDLSHEFHFPTSKGEDHLIKCSHCNYVANEEAAEIVVSERSKIDFENIDQKTHNMRIQVWRGISKNRTTLINVWFEALNSSKVNQSSTKVNFHAIKAVYPEFDPSVDDVSPYYSSNSPLDNREVFSKRITRIVNIIDYRVPVSVIEYIRSKDSQLSVIPPSLISNSDNFEIENIIEHPLNSKPLNLLRPQNGDQCPRCSAGYLKVVKAIEIGHTFYLGVRYTESLNASIPLPLEVIEREKIIVGEDPDSLSSNTRKVPMQMGCHGIGLSRMIGAVADKLADEKGLNWPRVMAPYEVVIVWSKGNEYGAEEVYDQLNSESTDPKIDAVLDDRNLTFPWKLQDADLIGYPIIIIVGKNWIQSRSCEVQCRQLKLRLEVSIEKLKEFISSLLERL